MTTGPAFKDEFVDAAMQGFKDMKLSAEETDRWAKAMKDPKFRDMFEDYLKEISDPSVRAETDEYLRQIEREARAGEVYGPGVVLVIPEPAWVFRTEEVESKRRCYVNVCISEKVDPAKAGAGGQWSIPLNLGPQREGKDSKGRAYTTHDFVIHPETRQLAQRNAAFRRMVEMSAVEEVEKARGLSLSREWKLSKASYKGVEGYDKPSVLAVRSNSGASPSTMGRVPPLPSAGAPTVSEPAPAPVAPAARPSAPAFDFGKAVKGPEAPKAEGEAGYRYASGEVVPAHRILHVGLAELPDVWRDARIHANHTRPASLDVRVRLPGVEGAAACTLDVSERSLSLVVPGKYRLEIALPYPVDDAKGKAKFDKAREELSVTLPVRPPPAPPATVTPAQAADQGADADVEGTAESPEVQRPEAEADETGPMCGGHVEGPPKEAESGGDQALVEESENMRRWREVHAQRSREVDTARAGTAASPGEATAVGGGARSGAGAAEAPAGGFVAATEFLGPRPGMVFKTGERGLGYYPAQAGDAGQGSSGSGPVASGEAARPRPVLGVKVRVNVSAADELD